jgi:hypothetical protein
MESRAKNPGNLSKYNPLDMFVIRSLYERAITLNPLDGFFWEEYICFLVLFYTFIIDFEFQN